MVDFNAWAQKSDTEKVYLVETSVWRLADGVVLPLYLGSRNILLEDRFYLGCAIGLPRLVRQANNALTPNRVSTWGELELQLEPDYRPDAQNSITWRDLLSSSYNFRGQALIIKVGDPAWAYGDFRTIFNGGLDKYRHTDTTMTVVVYDKARDLNQKLPHYGLPESPRVAEDRWDETVALLLGVVNNFPPTLITSSNPGAYPWKYALSCHVSQALVNAYYNNALLAAGYYQFIQKDLLPARKDGVGSAVLDLFGPYTGDLVQAEWMIEIDSITTPNSQGNSGSAVGLARFRWSTDGGRIWQGEGLLTWRLEYNPATLAKSPAAGDAAMTVSGTYTGDFKAPYRVKVVTGGHIGGGVAPQVKWSDDGELTWSDPIDVVADALNPGFSEAIPLNRGLSIVFTATGGTYSPSQTWTPIASAPGRMNCLASNPTDNVAVEITTGGSPGLGAMFKWDNGGGWSAPQAVESALEIYNPGSAYVVGDILEVVQSGASGMQAWVETVGGSGEVTGIRVKERGMTYSVADGLQTTTNSLAGVGCVLNVKAVDATGALDLRAIELFAGHSIGFTEGGLVGQDQYDTGDAGASFAVYTEPFVAGDQWSFGFREIPIPLADGVSIQFIDRATALAQGVDAERFLSSPEDFALGDNWRFILGSTVAFAVQVASGTITVDALGLVTPAVGYTDKIGELIRALPQGWRGWQDADIDLAALAAFNAAIPYSAGLAVTSPTEIASIIDQLLTGVPALYTMTQAGQFFIAELTPPTGTPVMALTDVEFLESPEQEDGDDDLYRRVYLNYGRNYNSEPNPQNAPSQERLAWLRNEYRQVSARDETVLELYPWAGDLGPLDTCLVDRDEAKALAAKDLLLFKTRHPIVKVLMKAQPFLLDIWQPVSIRRTRFGDAVGQVYAIAGKEENYSASEATLKLWR